MIYTPLRRIPIGEAVQRADGTYALRIKKPNKDEFDEISMDHLVAAVIKGPAFFIGTSRKFPPMNFSNRKIGFRFE